MKFIIPNHAPEALKHSHNATGEGKRSYLYDFAYGVIRFNQKALLEPEIARAYAESGIPSDATNRPERIEAGLNPSLSNTDFTTFEISEFSEARDAANDFCEKKIKTIAPTLQTWKTNRDAAVKFAELFAALLETASVKEFQIGDKVKLTHSGLKGEIVQIDLRSAFCYKVLFEFQVGEPGAHWVTPESLELTI